MHVVIKCSDFLRKYNYMPDADPPLGRKRKCHMFVPLGNPNWDSALIVSFNLGVNMQFSYPWVVWSCPPQNAASKQLPSTKHLYTHSYQALFANRPWMVFMGNGLTYHPWHMAHREHAWLGLAAPRAVQGCRHPQPCPRSCTGARWNQWWYYLCIWIPVTHNVEPIWTLYKSLWTC